MRFPKRILGLVALAWASFARAATEFELSTLDGSNGFRSGESKMKRPTYCEVLGLVHLRSIRKYFMAGCCAVGMLVSSAQGQGNLTVECLPTSGSTTVTGLETITVECYISIDSGSQEISGIQLDFFCDLPGQVGAVGGIGGGFPQVNPYHGGYPIGDWLFGPRYVPGAGDYHPGVWPINFPLCLVGGAPPPFPGVGPAVLTAALSPAYMGEITYEVSKDASGQFTFDLEGRTTPNPDPTDTTRILVTFDQPLPFNYAPNNFVAGCGTCQQYGDVFPFDPANPNQDLSGDNVGNCLVDIDDLMVVLGAFALSPNATVSTGGPFPDAVDMFPCGGAGGVVDIDDVMALLDAFGGNYACTHPCAPE